MSAGLLLLVIIVIGTIFVIGVYNGLIQKKVACDNAWSQIDVQLKRRHDLIPNLIETVKGYAAHEKETLERVIQARNSAISAQNAVQVAQTENVLTGALRQLFALAENYPDLKANQNFLQLQEELVSTENKIGFARQHYNDSVELYNTSIQQFPGNIVVGFGSFPKREFWAMDESEAREAPKVKF
ncbi:MAG: LemA family protein [SAR324 cluster bacterium]|uniref:LemA family protein n=1 Tax=SAR324 cluster bacterium TaxID=2024889 RepID=A0A7X9IJQ3_9DELT|nr:LemA family protein [SAR324 cluster bacterium]